MGTLRNQIPDSGMTYWWDKDGGLKWVPHPLRMKKIAMQSWFRIPSDVCTKYTSYQRILYPTFHCCRSVSLSSVRTAFDPQPVLWTLNHLYRLKAILTDPVEKLSSDIEPGLQVYRTLTGQHLFTDQKTLLHSQNFSARFFESSFFLYNVIIL